MTVVQTPPAHRFRRRLLPWLTVQAAVLAASAAQAAAIDLDNPDINLRWDNTVRYNLGVRVQKQNPAFANNAGYDDTESRFDRGDIVTSRFDLVSELDFIFKNKHGFRLSGAAWADTAYDKQSQPNQTAFPSNNSGNYANNEFNSYTKRYIVGPSGEMLDAFVFTGFNLGDVSVSLKAGKHNVYWGESLYSIANSIAYSQGPVDTIKSATSPGAEAKELFMPLTQLSAQVQLSQDFSIAGQYLLDWKPFRLVPGGTYFATSDGSRSDYAASTPLVIRNGNDVEPDKKHGDFGLSARWSPDWLNGTMGFYYRKFDEKLPWAFTQLRLTGVASPAVLPSAVRLSFARDTELYGLSLSKSLASISVASELSYRRHSALQSNSGFPVLVTAGDVNYSQAEGARGNTIHALVNGIYLLPTTPLWQGGTLQAELSYVFLDKITSNPTNSLNPLGVYYSGGHQSCTAANQLGCADRSAWSLNVGMTPEWPQALPGVDLSMPMSLAYGIKGNSPTLGGTTDGSYNWSLGLTAKVRGVYEFSMKYVDSYTEYQTGATGLYTRAQGSNAVQNDHGWVALSFKTTF